MSDIPAADLIAQLEHAIAYANEYHDPLITLRLPEAEQLLAALKNQY